tara:strand:- start:1645 stop:1851 length:207 start_codon:yes stop_codon:yes gene_type:complete
MAIAGVLLLVATSLFVNIAFRGDVDDGPQIQQKLPTSVTHDSPFRYDPDYPSYMYDNDVWGNPYDPYD